MLKGTRHTCPLKGSFLKVKGSSRQHNQTVDYSIIIIIIFRNSGSFSPPCRTVKIGMAVFYNGSISMIDIGSFPRQSVPSWFVIMSRRKPQIQGGTVLDPRRSIDVRCGVGSRVGWWYHHLLLLLLLLLLLGRVGDDVEGGGFDVFLGASGALFEFRGGRRGIFLKGMVGGFGK
jgi:hypothetical protein